MPEPEPEPEPWVPAPEPEPVPEPEPKPEYLFFSEISGSRVYTKQYRDDWLPAGLSSNNFTNANFGLTHVYISGDGETPYKIGDYAFQDCISLKSIRFAGGLNKIGMNAFSGCTNLETVTFLGNMTDDPDSDWGTPTAEIRAWAFYECTSLTSINLPHHSII